MGSRSSAVGVGDTASGRGSRRSIDGAIDGSRDRGHSGARDLAGAVGLLGSARSDGDNLSLVYNLSRDGHGNTEDGGRNGKSGETHFD